MVGCSFVCGDVHQLFAVLTVVMCVVISSKYLWCWVCGVCGDIYHLLAVLIVVLCVTFGAGCGVVCDDIYQILLVLVVVLCLMICINYFWYWLW